MQPHAASVPESSAAVQLKAASTPLRSQNFWSSLVKTSIEGASKLSEINGVLRDHGRRLHGSQLICLLAKLAAFSMTDTEAWLDEGSVRRSGTAGPLKKGKAATVASKRKTTAVPGDDPTLPVGTASVIAGWADEEDAYLDGTAWDGSMGSELDSDLSDEDHLSSSRLGSGFRPLAIEA